ncbi:MAG: F0F1 ATP synthase subunit alpha [Verrucomicrobia bacterium]|jgi:F-type H+-transporting ATPase subunit alpha|nr:F0F1 ATP synthase subunit alpha [Verrucomicrobiota bacterium]
MSNAIEQIQKAIAGLDARAGKSNVGTIVSLADGVAAIDGLSGVMMNEMVEFPGGLQGVALNLAEDTVGCVVMGDISKLKEGMEAKTTGRLLSVPVGKGLLGRVVDALGNPVDGKGPLQSTERYPVEKIAPGIMPRKSVDQPMQTGIMAIDAMIPIGRGQRELIIGDRATGKTTIAIDTIINQANANRVGLASGDKNFRPVYSIYVAVGAKNSSIARTIGTLERAGALEFCVVVAAPAADNAANQVFAPFSGTAIGEWFMENGHDALIVYDDLSKHAAAYRQISLILKRPSGREAYPGDVFYLHSRLLERSARLAGKGSLTALPIIETQAGDVSAYIPTNVISITDGQVFLQTDLFNQGIRPAVSVGLSVSRVGSAAQIKAFKQVAGKVKGELAQYRELAAFAQFGSDLDAQTKGVLDKGDRFVELFKQPPNAPKSAEIQVALIWAMQNGFFSDVAVKSVQAAAAGLQTHLESAKPASLARIRVGEKIDDAMAAELKSACDVWKRSFKA